VHVVRAPLATFVTVKTVPKGSVGLAHLPGGAAAYHVACPCSLSPLVVGGVGAAATFGATVGVTDAAARTTTGVEVGGVLVGVAEGVTVVGVTGGTVVGAADAAAWAAWYRIICVGSTTL
jgi:hypothetical protein